MKLAEALIERAALQRRIEQLQSRIVQNARYQEGEEPAEDAAALLLEAGDALASLRDLILAINLTNAATTTVDGEPLTAALATRDVLRSELRQVAALPVGELRTEADALAKRIRDLESTIQQANWEVGLQQR